MKELKITSPAFKHNEFIPAKYTCKGQDINPPLIIDNIPEGTQSLVLILDDPDAPMGNWDHWIVWNIQPTDLIEENSVPGIQGLNDFDKHDYGGPCPPSGTHHYFFKLYALNTKLTLSANSRKKDVEKAIANHTLAKGQLIGLFKK